MPSVVTTWRHAQRGASSVVTPDFLEDFSTYTSQSNFDADPLGHWNAPQTSYATITLDQTTGVGTHPYGSSDQCMKYTWTGNPACTTALCQRRLDIPTPQANKVWIEFCYALSTNYTPDANCGTTAIAHKWFNTYGPSTGQSHGFSIERIGANANAQLKVNASSYYNGVFSLDDDGDGLWHTLRMAIDQTASPMTWDVWLDGVHKVQIADGWTSSDTIRQFRQENMNQGPVTGSASEGMWWRHGYYAIWYENNDPGW